MKIAFDHQAFVRQSYGGVSRYCTKLAQQLTLCGQDIHVCAPIHRNHHLQDLNKDSVHGKELKNHIPYSKPAIYLINKILCNAHLKRLKPDIIHETYYSPLHSGNIRTPRVVTVHDMIHELFPNNFSIIDRTAYNKRISISRADKIICISNNTKKDLINILNVPESKIHVVHSGFEHFHECANPLPCSIIKPYILYV